MANDLHDSQYDQARYATPATRKARCEMNGMTQRTPKRRFWTVLTIINIAAMMYPIKLYVQADSNDAQFFAAIVLLGVALLLVITDTVSAIVAYMQ